jgi:hypothetical protein
VICNDLYHFAICDRYLKSIQLNLFDIFFSNEKKEQFSFHVYIEMNNNNTICKHYCSLAANQCYYCHPQEISTSYHCYCSSSYSISMEEMFTWIIICALTFLLYNTIRICIITFIILFIIYWIYKRTFIRDFIEENKNSDLSIIKFIQSIGRQWINLTSSIDDKEEQKGEYTNPIDSNVEQKYSNNNVSLKRNMIINRIIKYFDR